MKDYIKKHHLYEKFVVRPGNRLITFLSSWWQLLILVFFAFIFLYYPIGGFIVNDIDTNTTYEINDSPQGQSATVDMMSYLIRRETKYKIWTPNLPFIFPSYFLDNMPNFQLGMISAISNTATAMSKRLQKTIKTDEKPHLKTAAELLRYPGTVWMFSPQNPLVPAPSATTQYNRARKHLISYNQELTYGSEIFYKSPADLSFILFQINKDLRSGNNQLTAHIRENSTNLFDLKADNVFYYQQGKIYAYYLLIKALGTDYKEILINYDLYNSWTRLLKALEDGAHLDPLLVRNADLNSSIAPNHLSYLAYYELKAVSLNQKIIQELNSKMTKQRKIQ